MKILFLLPPSEGKNPGGISEAEHLSFTFEKPLEIPIQASEKDLKCKGKRYEEGIELNKMLVGNDCNRSLHYLPAISRYSGVMYNAINYAGMTEIGQKYFENNFLILSGMYGLVKPLDTIGNYKLPIETKGLYSFWGNKVTQSLNNMQADIIVDLLPNSYKKMIDFSQLNTKLVRIDFFKDVSGEIKKISHGVKKIKGEYIKNICEKCIEKIEDFPGEKVQISEKEYHIQVII